MAESRGPRAIRRGVSRRAQPRLGGPAALSEPGRAHPAGRHRRCRLRCQADREYVGEGSADPKRIYITGISNGGAMTMTMICKRADLFAAAASVIFNLTDESAEACRPSRPVPMLLMNGTADPLIPYEGGRGTSRFAVDGYWSTEKTLKLLAAYRRLRRRGRRIERSR